MSWDPDAEDTTLYRAVMNHEEQYSIWPVDRKLPLGWLDAGKTGTKADCLAHIERVWTDMRPLSLRKRMAESQAAEPDTDSEPSGLPDAAEPLVDRLCTGQHPVAVRVYPQASVAAFKERLDRGYVHLLFPDTRGGTELRVALEAAALDVSRASLASETGTVRLAGTLTLDSVPVTCVADIDLATLRGFGHLERRTESK